MKKKKLSSLGLNKKTISKLNSSHIRGGNAMSGNCDVTISCPGGGPCSFPHPGQTQGPGCTRDTRELSYCHGITIPDGCLSVNPCA